MKRRTLILAMAGLALAATSLLMAAGSPRLTTVVSAAPKEPAFKVLAFYSTDVEPDHVKTAKDAFGKQDSKHNIDLKQSHYATAQFGRRQFGNVHRSQNRRAAYA